MATAYFAKERWLGKTEQVRYLGFLPESGIMPTTAERFEETTAPEP